MALLNMLGKHRLLFIFISVYLSACATIEEQTTQSPEKQAKSLPIIEEPSLFEQALGYEKNEKWLDAAAIYNKLSTETPPPQRHQFKLKSVELFIKGNNFEPAKFLLQDIDNAQLSPSNRSLFALYHAKIALHERNAETAIAWIMQAPVTEQMPFELQLDIRQLKVTAFEMVGNIQEAVDERVIIDAMLTDNPVILANQQAILLTLSSLPEADILRILSRPTSITLLGWTELSFLLKKAQDSYQLANQIEAWVTRFPNHPIQPSLLSSLTPPKDESPLALNTIALLLPFEGPFKKAGEAVRDGFIAAYYNDHRVKENNPNSLPTLQFYNSGTATPENNIVQLFEQAIANGADIIVGPLHKKSVDTLARNAHFSVPTVALNYLEDHRFFAHNLYQFGLSPEDEAQQLAERAWLDGHTNSAIIFPEGNWGQRLQNAFTEYWETLGGTVVGAKSYNPQKNDFSDTIKSLLNINQSNERRRALSKRLRRKLEFEPYRRQDVDLIFMAAFPRQARLIPPQFKFYRARKIPIYTTSHSFTGKIDPSADRDMNGVVIADMPWTLETSSGLPIRDTIQNAWPMQSKKLGRLFALGVDAYRTLRNINWLRANPNAQLHGATGKLHMDDNNHIYRRVTWAKFQRGIPEIIIATPNYSAHQ